MPLAKLEAQLTLRDVKVLSGQRCLLQVDSLEASGGTLLHLTGENGAGKTTLLRALVGEATYRGHIRAIGAVPGTVAAKAQTAYVPTEATLLNDLTVAENMMFMASAWQRNESEIYALAEEFGLRTWWDAWPAELSRGTRQKVGLSIGLGLGLPLTLLDEPFGTLDSASRNVLLRMLEARVATGGLVLVTTHGNELAGTARRVIHIHNGALVAA